MACGRARNVAYLCAASRGWGGMGLLNREAMLMLHSAKDAQAPFIAAG